MVVRPILPSSAEFRCPAAQAALLKELKRLVDGEVWLVNTVRNRSDVVKSGVPSLVTRVHAIMGQKNSEMGVPGEFNARIVIGGNNMSSSDGRPAHELFQEVSGPPSAMSGTRGVLASAALTGNQITVRMLSQPTYRPQSTSPAARKRGSACRATCNQLLGSTLKATASGQTLWSCWTKPCMATQSQVLCGRLILRLS